ncbi:uncharacterized protein SCHCODRAFT_02541156 [Schizophyllum commune H4-8]|uniref:uncharacterized protein n=1 Tax=Schizophyllum commune (strain H4-8 / FGSC 9210) TaxID=578458 RepID=UPI00215FF426|nr:uncharacterized protein SCHCODRAFT_02541156 [Schizophyllum commune H4-8]KAI5891941.1 hypothetical protein SCHCODRAFT_02541156 [Schizophyllum commune H4-8]
MTLPWRGAYVVLSLDPASSLKDIDDPIVNEDLRKMKCGRYVATATEDHHPLSALMPQRTFSWDFVVQGMPSDAPEVFFKSYMTVPILPNTTHPESRRPVEPLPHLPWEGCYHARLYRTVAICETLDTEENPQSCLSPEEAAVLDQYISTDNNYSVLCERAKQDGEYPPLHDVPAQVLMAIRLANKRRRADGKPWWAIVCERAQKRQAEEAAQAVAFQSSTLPTTVSPLSDHTPISQEMDSAPSRELSLPPIVAETPTVRPSPAAQATQERQGSGSDSGSDACSVSGPEDMLAALLGLDELEKQLPWVKIESYNIQRFDVPPHPSGFFEELKELERIRSDYIERQKKRLEDVQRQDADYMASIEARGRPVSGPAKQTLATRISTSTKRVRRLMSRGSRAKETTPANIEAVRASTEASGPPASKKSHAIQRLRHLIFSRITVSAA